MAAGAMVGSACMRNLGYTPPTGPAEDLPLAASIVLDPLAIAEAIECSEGNGASCGLAGAAFLPGIGKVGKVLKPVSRRYNDFLDKADAWSEAVRPEFLNRRVPGNQIALIGVASIQVGALSCQDIGGGNLTATMACGAVFAVTFAAPHSLLTGATMSRNLANAPKLGILSAGLLALTQQVFPGYGTNETVTCPSGYVCIPISSFGLGPAPAGGGGGVRHR
jgi:hypothetical protein